MLRGKLMRLVVVAALALAAAWAGHAAGSLVGAGNDGVRAGEEVPALGVLLGRSADGSMAPVQIAARPAPLVLFALSVDCQFCRRNLPYWRDVVRGLGSLDSPPEVLVLSLSPPDETADYLRENRLPGAVVFVDSAELEALGLRGVPATILVPPGSGAMRKWIGVMDEVAVENVVASARLLDRAGSSRPINGTQ